MNWDDPVFTSFAVKIWQRLYFGNPGKAQPGPRSEGGHRESVPNSIYSGRSRHLSEFSQYICRKSLEHVFNTKFRARERGLTLRWCLMCWRVRRIWKNMRLVSPPWSRCSCDLQRSRNWQTLKRAPTMPQQQMSNCLFHPSLSL